MALALEQAHVAANAGEVPVGAVVVKDGKVIAVGRNAPVASHDPTAHAEIIALRAAALALGNYRLDGCELYVTLEPCSMCAGAIINARLSRLIYGAADTKAGAAGSVLDLFALAGLNHHTLVEGGILADACAITLQEFFQIRRRIIRSNAQPLREDALRSPDSCFSGIHGFPWLSRYTSDLPTMGGLRLHYIDEGAADAQETILCIHNTSSWGYAFRSMIAQWLAQGKRVVVPDLIGFGRSDKPKRASVHTVDFHCQSLLELLEQLQVKSPVVIVLQDDLSESPMEPTAAGAPFPDIGYRAAVNAFNGEKCSVKAIADALRTRWLAR